jgi:hypothetical protein
VTFESGSALLKIGNHALKESGLRSIVLPASVQVIGLYAFAWCRSLTSVTFEDESNLREIGYGAFQGCPCKRRVKIPHLQIDDCTRTEK